ncbi:hypothetical protein SOPP22_15575 [Shewanella sp. OPT22]|nr:hypothetical protein SOPP22_15575 [Shewanella sp. OPT22]
MLEILPMTMPIFKGAIREGMNQNKVEVQKISDEQYTFKISGREFDVKLEKSIGKEELKVTNVREKTDSRSGFFHCFFNVLHAIRVSTTSTRIRDVLNESNYSIANYSITPSPRKENEETFLIQNRNDDYGSAGRTEHEGTEREVLLSQSFEDEEVEQSQYHSEVGDTREATEGFSQCTMLSDEEQSFLKGLEGELDIEPLAPEEGEEDEIIVEKPSARRERSGSMAITWRYERTNIENNPLRVVSDEVIPEFSSGYPHDNREEKAARNADTLNRRAAVHLYKSEHKENEYWYHPSTCETFDKDLKKVSAQQTSVGCRAIALGGKTYYELNPATEPDTEDREDSPPESVTQFMVYEPAEEPKYVMTGKEEKIVRINNEFVSLRKSRGEYSTEDKKEMEKRLEVVKEHKDCICRSWIVDKDKVISEYGGRDVKKFYCRSDHKLERSQVAPFLKLVRDVHQRGYHFKNISNHNLLCAKDGKPIRFTGWKYIVGNECGDYEYSMEDEHLAPKRLKEWVLDTQDKEEQLKRALVLQRYAVLVMMCESMSPAIARSINADLNQQEFGNSLMIGSNKKYFIEWVKKNIKIGCQKGVLLFLRDPIKRPLTSDLIDMMKS